ncbi:MAG: hypothetical protein IPH58_06310 [Sphingobacteriales bacterium]|jgi:hypothetical protein|nr:hypothetical protein [Sphingobacteriales bacterium]
MKTYYIPVILFLVLVLVFCCRKKDKAPKTKEQLFMGLWVEESRMKDTILVTKEQTQSGAMMILYPNGKPAIPFGYSFFSNGDSIRLSSMASADPKDRNVPYKISFEGENKFTIKKFYSSLPDGDPLTFYKGR